MKKDWSKKILLTFVHVCRVVFVCYCAEIKWVLAIWEYTVHSMCDGSVLCMLVLIRGAAARKCPGSCPGDFLASHRPGSLQGGGVPAGGQRGLQMGLGWLPGGGA